MASLLLALGAVLFFLTGDWELMLALVAVALFVALNLHPLPLVALGGIWFVLTTLIDDDPVTHVSPSFGLILMSVAAWPLLRRVVPWPLILEPSTNPVRFVRGLYTRRLGSVARKHVAPPDQLITAVFVGITLLLLVAARFDVVAIVLLVSALLLRATTTTAVLGIGVGLLALTGCAFAAGESELAKDSATASYFCLASAVGMDFIHALLSRRPPSAN